jgi:hypothetical protein
MEQDDWFVFYIAWKGFVVKYLILCVWLLIAVILGIWHSIL